MVKMVNFMVCVSYHNLKNDDNNKKPRSFKRSSLSHLFSFIINLAQLCFSAKEARQRVGRLEAEIWVSGRERQESPAQ